MAKAILTDEECIAKQEKDIHSQKTVSLLTRRSDIVLTELNMLDHTLLDENEKTMIMLIFDVEDLWRVELPRGLEKFSYKKKCSEKNMEHLVFLKKKVENYVSYILNNGIKQSFPHCDETESFSYEIRVVTNFTPAPDYLDLIKQMNNRISIQGLSIIITTEEKRNP